jgi:ATP-dependent Clp protease protease subunit
MKWFSITNSAAAAQVAIMDYIGEGGLTAKDFAESFKAIPAGRKINLSINSPGGSVFDGLAIYNAILPRRKDVTARVEGLAASIASVITCAAGRVEMPANSFMMIHNASAGLTVGNASDHSDMAALLDKMDNQLATIYARRTGRPFSDVKAKMNAQTWFTAQEARDFGLIDSVTDEISMSASADGGVLGTLIAQFKALKSPNERQAFFKRNASALRVCGLNA